uniref:Uncharacterized protein n=1 Tax=uncultured bacterium A1Q1_fos_1877 TaxID=1256555 RepID=L7VXN0_9BACT|nr:hypothetical protein [uncultured bacterium A1Q1_fos_1877]
MLSTVSNVPVLLSVMRALSPTTIPRALTLEPFTVTESDPAPPATTLYPTPTPIVSAPPTLPFRLLMVVVPVGLPLPSVSTS